MSKITIREMQAEDTERLHDIVVKAFEPVFESFYTMMGDKIFAFYFSDWKQIQSSLVDTFFKDSESHTWVATADDIPVGLVVYRLKEKNEGEIEFLFVDPDHQDKGTGTRLSEFALNQMQAAGVKVATVATGGDPGHAPARRAYEKAGFLPIPQVWYIKHLGDEE